MNDTRPIFVTGSAGTGKTSRLMELAGDLGERLVTEPMYQCVLAITQMHGARRRIDTLIRKKHPNLPVRVMTIHSFALGIANRWRMVAGYEYPIAVNPDAGGFRVCDGGSHATIDEFTKLAVDLLEHQAVRTYVSASYPVIVVDEFQDCVGLTFELIRALSEITKMVIAADDFQQLEITGEESSAAVRWLEDGRSDGSIEHIELVEIKRTSIPAIIATASALREKRSTNLNIPQFWAPSIHMLAMKIRVQLQAGKIKGTCAVISPSHEPQLTAMLAAVDSQLSKNNAFSPSWIQSRSHTVERQELLSELGVETDIQDDVAWTAPPLASLTPSSIQIVDRIKRFCKLRGITPIRHSIAGHIAESSLHSQRVYAHRDGRFEVTTVHGAKNREFDHVFVFWGYKVAPGAELQRRLLYNAVTRAKLSCTLLVLRSTEQQVANDPVLNLLGTFTPAIIPKKRTSVKPKVAKPTRNTTGSLFD